MKKILTILFALLLVLTTTSVSASSNNYEIIMVSVDDMGTVFGNTANPNAVEVERGKEIEVKVEFRGTGEQDNVRVKAEIDGYEHGSITDKTSTFLVESGVIYKKTLYLDIPSDIDASEDYKLRVRVADKDDYDERSCDVRIKESRHDIEIQDIIFRPSTYIEADSAVFVTVRLENTGYKKEEDIKVRLTIPEIGIITSDYLDELITQKQEDDDNRDDESSGQVELFARIPENAKTGDYEAKVEVIYNNGHDIITETKTLHIEGVKSAEVLDSMISVDATSKSVDAGSEVVYKVMFANFEQEKIVYSAEVTGVGTFATALVDPAFVTIQPDETGELYVKLNTNDNADAGKHAFTVKIKSAGKTVKEVNLEVDVQAKAGMGDLKSVLQIGFAVLAIILVILGLIIAFRKLREDEGEEESLEEPSAGQTYY